MNKLPGTAVKAMEVLLHCTKEIEDVVLFLVTSFTYGEEKVTELKKVLNFWKKTQTSLAESENVFPIQSRSQYKRMTSIVIVQLTSMI